MTIAASAAAAGLEIALPPRTKSLDQNREWCVVHWNGRWRKVLIHDYEAIFSIPGFYEQLIYDVLNCRSPETVRDLLHGELTKAGFPPSDLHVLDLGAGNGMVAEQLVDMGAGSVIGVDIIGAAAEAAERDRPEVYEDYHVLDMTSLSQVEQTRLACSHLNGLICVAALGFGDIPPRAFVNAFNLIKPSGWVAFNIKEEFLGNADRSGFSRLVWLLESTGALKVRAKRRYRHRRGTDGRPIHYVAIVGRKMFDATDSLFSRHTPSRAPGSPDVRPTMNRRPV